jgi:hypothetical protein
VFTLVSNFVNLVLVAVVSSLLEVGSQVIRLIA